MPLAVVREHTGGQSKTAGTTIAATTITAAVPVGNLLVVSVAADNTSASAPLLNSLSVPAGETASWQVITGANTVATAGGGIRYFMAYIFTTVSWPVGTTVTATLSASVTARAIAMTEWTGVGPFVQYAIGVQSTAGTPTATMVSANTRSGGMVVAMAAFENSAAPTADTDTTNGNWSGLSSIGTTGGTANTNVFIGGQYKILTAAGDQTYNPVGVADSGVIMLSFAPRDLSASGTVLVFSNVSGSGTVPAKKLLHLDAGNPSSYPGSGTTWTDLATPATNFTLGGAVYDADGGGSFDFSPGARYAVSAAEISLDRPMQFAMDFWLKPDNTTDFAGSIFDRDGGVDGYALNWESGEFRSYGNGNNSAGASGTAGVWQHVVVDYKITGTEIWVNGVLMDTGSASLPSGSGTNPVSSAISAPSNFNGKIAIARVWDFYLTPTEIANLYSAESSRFAGGGATQWPASGTVAVNSVVTGSTTSRRPISGTVPVNSGVTGSTTSRLPSSGTTPIVSTVSGDGTVSTPTTQYPASGTVAITSTVTGSTTKVSPASGTAAVISDAIGSVGKLQSAAGTVNVVSSVSGTAIIQYSASGTVAVVASASGVTTLRAVASGTAPVVSTVTGTASQVGAPTQWPASGTVAITSAVATGATGAKLAAAGTVPVISQINGAVVSKLPSSGTAAAVSTVTGAAIRSVPAGGTVPIVSNLTGTIAKRTSAAGTITIVSSISATIAARLRATGGVGIVSTAIGSAEIAGGKAYAGIKLASKIYVGEEPVIAVAKGTEIIWGLS